MGKVAQKMSQATIYVFLLLIVLAMVFTVGYSIKESEKRWDMELAEAQRQFEAVMQKMDEYVAAAKACKFEP